MATQTVTVTMDDNSWSFSHQATLPDSDMTRVIHALRVKYGPIGIGNGTTRPLTEQECFSNLLADLQSSITANVVQLEGDTAAVTAKAAIIAPAWSNPKS